VIEKDGNYGIEVLLGKRNRRPPEEVKRVLNVPYDGLVWDATTEDSTFITGVGQWTVVHNTQPARFDLRSGMARRFLFINNIPTLKDLAEVKDARRKTKNMRYNPVRTDRIRQELKNIKARVEGIDHITWDEEKIYKKYDELKLLHWEEKLYDNMLMGYWIMRGKFSDELFVTLDDIITNYILQEARHRDTIRRGSEFAEILLLMREHDGEIEEFQLKDELLAFGKDWRQSRMLIDDLIHIRALTRSPTGTLKLSHHLRGEKTNV